MAQWGTMQQLQFVELDEGGRLVVVGDDGTRYAVPVDDRLRAALRPRPVAKGPDRSGTVTVSPRDVQSMIRAGQTAEEVSASTGWEIERIRRFEGPVLAEREHVVGLAQRAHVRAQGRTDGSHTLDRRVRERLQGRGVELTEVAWDAARHEAHGPWTVMVVFPAGGRERRAAWHYDVQTRSIDALDDEARWLSEDEQALPGGLAGHPLVGGHGEDEVAADLMASMRERRQRRGRRRKEEATDDPAHVPGQQAMPHEVLPLEDLGYDPDTMGLPPAAHPRGSAPEAAAPVGPDPAQPDVTEQRDVPGQPDVPEPLDVPVTETEEPQETTDEQPPAGPSGRGSRRLPSRRERRRLRIPRLPAPSVDGPPQEDPEPEGTYARTRIDPHEVSFEEFFGTDEVDDELEGDELVDAELEDGELAEVEDQHDELEDPDAHDDLTTAQTEVGDQEAPSDEELSLGVIEGGTLDDVDETAGERREIEEPETAGADIVQPDVQPTDAEVAGDGSEAEPDPGPGPEPVAAPETPASPGQRPAQRKGRTSVPSWDDIMFGSKDRR